MEPNHTCPTILSYKSMIPVRTVEGDRRVVNSGQVYQCSEFLPLLNLQLVHFAPKPVDE